MNLHTITQETAAGTGSVTRTTRTCPLVGLLVIAASLAGASAEDASKAAAKPEPKTESPKEALTKTRHAITVAGAKLEYEATAGTLVLKDDNKAKASIFFVAYTKAGVPDPAQRPITFAFNGGPGSSSVWLHLGAFGPRRIPLRADGETMAPPYRLVDNESTLLDLTDLVFIDPVTTGYSRAAPGQNPQHFHGVQADIETIAQFIRLYTTRFQRWNSPKFLAGESYGTTRAAGLVRYLQDQAGIDLNGVILISSVLNFEVIGFDPGNDLPYILYLPTYTATAWYHKKLPADLQADRRKALDEAERFALGEYTLALMKGSALPAGQRRRIVQKLARYTGLPEDYVDRSNLRIEISRFVKELLRDRRRVVGRFDSRSEGIDLDAAGTQSKYDPSYALVRGAYTAVVNRYLRTELKYQSDLPYRILTARVQPWDYGTAKNRYLNVGPSLRKAMTENRGLHVFVANGSYDLATPFLATKYTFTHLGLDPTLAGHVTMEYYDAGHMVYTDKPSLRKLKKDLTAFFHASVPW